MRNRQGQGCLAGLLEMFLLDRIFVWLERRFGFGRGCSCSGCVILVLFVLVAGYILTNTNWLHLLR